MNQIQCPALAVNPQWLRMSRCHRLHLLLQFQERCEHYRPPTTRLRWIPMNPDGLGVKQQEGTLFLQQEGSPLRDLLVMMTPCCEILQKTLQQEGKKVRRMQQKVTMPQKMKMFRQQQFHGRLQNKHRLIGQTTQVLTLWHALLCWTVFSSRHMIWP